MDTDLKLTAVCVVVPGCGIAASLWVDEKYSYFVWLISLFVTVLLMAILLQEGQPAK